MIELLRTVFLLIGQEHVVLYPAMIFAFFGNWLSKLLPFDQKKLGILAGYLAASWLLNLFIQLLTAEIGSKVLNNKDMDFNAVLLKTTARFFPAVFCTGILVFLTGLFIFVSYQQAWLSIIMFPLIITVSIALQIYPVIYVTSEQGALSVYQLLWHLLFKNVRCFWQIFIFLIFSTFIFLMLTAVIQAMPLQFNAVILPLLQGLFNVVVCYAVLLIWRDHDARIKVSV